MEVKHYVSFYIPQGQQYKEVVKENPSGNIKDIAIPEKAVGFYTYDCVSDDVVKNGKIIAKKTDRYNDKLYYIGTLLNFDEVTAQYGAEATKTLKDGGYVAAIKTIENLLEPVKPNELYTMISPADFYKNYNVEYDDPENANC